MDNLLVCYERDMPTVSDTRLVFSRLSAMHQIKVRFLKSLVVTPSDISNAHIIMFIRPCDYYSLKLAQLAKKNGHFVIVYFDDDLLNLPAEMADIPWRKKNARQVITICDVLLTCNPFIGEKLSKHMTSPRYVLLDSSIEEVVRKAYPYHEEVRIVYAAGSSHAKLFEEYINPVMPELIRRFPGKFSLTFMGVKPDVGRFKDQVRISFIDSMPLEAFRSELFNGDYDLGLSPLHTDDFSKSKYFNKFFEYTLAGIVGIYTASEPYTFVVRNGENGFLANNDTGDWLETLSLAIENYSLRKRCIEKAYDLLENRFDQEKIFEKLLRDIPELTRKESWKYGKWKGRRGWRLAYHLYRMLDRIYLIWFYLKKQGPGGVYRQIRNHIIDMRAFE